MRGILNFAHCHTNGNLATIKADESNASRSLFAFRQSRSAKKALCLSVQFHNSDFEQQRRHAEEACPAECCGVLLGEVVGEDRRVIRVVRCANAASDSSHCRYEIDPAELVRIQRQARADGLEIVGFYHSHPDHPAHWSETDLRDAHWIGCSYVITSVLGGKAGETRSFLLSGTREEDKAFVEEPLIVDVKVSDS
jgi:proteasome lid subunit RPN8/RPN11